MTLSLDQFQTEQNEWRLRNFPGTKDPALVLIGVVEELGELADEHMISSLMLLMVTSKLGALAHSHLKAAQGIRGTQEEHDAKARDSIGDMLVYMADYCNRRGWNLQEILETTWSEVRARDWQANKHDGRT